MKKNVPAIILTAFLAGQAFCNKAQAADRSDDYCRTSRELVAKAGQAGRKNLLQTANAIHDAYLAEREATYRHIQENVAPDSIAKSVGSKIYPVTSDTPGVESFYKVAACHEESMALISSQLSLVTHERAKLKPREIAEIDEMAQNANDFTKLLRQTLGQGNCDEAMELRSQYPFSPFQLDRISPQENQYHFTSSIHATNKGVIGADLLFLQLCAQRPSTSSVSVFIGSTSPQGERLRND